MGSLNQAAVIPNHCGTISYKVAAYTSGSLDSLGGSGLSMFMSVIFTMNQLLDLNPYGWIIGLAALCGLNAIVMNMLFSVKQGTETTLSIVYSPNPALQDDIERQSLLSGTEDAQHDTTTHFYQTQRPSDTLLFDTSVQTTNIQEATPDIEPALATKVALLQIEHRK